MNFLFLPKNKQKIKRGHWDKTKLKTLNELKSTKTYSARQSLGLAIKPCNGRP